VTPPAAPRPVHVAALRVVTARPPVSAFLRPAIAAGLAGRPWPPGAEATVAAAVVAAVREAVRGAAPEPGR